MCRKRSSSESARRLAGRLDKSAAFAPKGRCRVNSPTLHSLGEAPHAYAYDNIGNRITAQEDAESVTYEANNLNQYTQIDTDGTAFVPEYDEDGNQTRVRTVTGIWKVQYNAQNRAIRYESEADSTHVITCVYDSQGRRVEKKEEKEGAAISHVRYVYRGYLQVAAYDLLAEGLPSLWQIIWDPTQEIATRPLAIRANGAYSTYGWDLTKNICETYAGATGFLVHRYAYSPYGLVSIEGDTSYQPIQWSSEVYDAELGLVYYNYRYYNPLDGRWTRRDPAEPVLLEAAYVYMKNSSLVDSDYLGLLKQWSSITFLQAWSHYQNGQGESVQISFDLIDTSSVSVVEDFKDVKEWLESQRKSSKSCEKAEKEFEDARTTFKTTGQAAFVLGTITLKFIGKVSVKCDCHYEVNGELRAYDDKYDFDQHKGKGESIRNVKTRLAEIIHGKGTPYTIEIRGGRSVSIRGVI